MGRIRTIKPDFFRHEGLFDAEIQTGLPLRLAFAALWTASDREGRFKWRPRTLKSECLPFDEVDFSRVLDALATRGFIIRYRVVDGSENGDFGAIVNWAKHQVINNRESPSVLPSLKNGIEIFEENDASGTREARVDGDIALSLCNAQGEREGERERKGRGNRVLNLDSESSTKIDSLTNNCSSKLERWFDDFWHAYPKRVAKRAAEKKFQAVVKSGVDPPVIIAAAARYAAACRSSSIDKNYIKAPDVWLNKGCYLDEDMPSARHLNGFAAVLHELKEQEANEQTADNSGDNLRTVDLHAVEIGKRN